jgi:hypothetical protein
MPDPRNWDWGTCLGVVAGHHWERGGEPGSCAELRGRGLPPAVSEKTMGGKRRR